MKVFQHLLVFYFLVVFQVITRGEVITNNSDSTIVLSSTKTIVLVFPDPISNVDLGNDELFGGDLKDNILKLKAYTDFKEVTSLIVITAPGDVYSFNVACYIPKSQNSEPKKLVTVISPDQASYKAKVKQEAPSSSFPSEPEISEASQPTASSKTVKGKKNTVASEPTKAKIERVDSPYKSLCEQVLNQPSTLVGIGTRDIQEKLLVAAKAIYIKHGKLYFKVFIENTGNLKYDVSFFRFSKVDKNKTVTKMESEQENSLLPVYVYNGEINSINAKEKLERVYVFDKFTLDASKKILVETGEEEGRMVSFFIPQQELLNARSLD